MKLSTKLLSISLVSHFVLLCKAFDWSSIAPISPIYQHGHGQLGEGFHMTQPRSSFLRTLSEIGPMVQDLSKIEEVEPKKELSDNGQPSNDDRVLTQPRSAEEDFKRKQVSFPFNHPNFLRKTETARSLIANRLASLGNPWNQQSESGSSFRLKRKRRQEQSNLSFRLKKSNGPSKEILMRTHRQMINIQKLRHLYRAFLILRQN